MTRIALFFPDHAVQLWNSTIFEGLIPPCWYALPLLFLNDQRVGIQFLVWSRCLGILEFAASVQMRADKPSCLSLFDFAMQSSIVLTTLQHIQIYADMMYPRAATVPVVTEFIIFRNEVIGLKCLCATSRCSLKLHLPDGARHPHQYSKGALQWCHVSISTIPAHPAATMLHSSYKTIHERARLVQ